MSCKTKDCNQKIHRTGFCFEHFVQTWTQTHLHTKMEMNDWTVFSQTHPNEFKFLVHIWKHRIAKHNMRLNKYRDTK